MCPRLLGRLSPISRWAWVLFEAKLCNRHANPNKVVSVADASGGQALDPCMQAALDYWKNRYVQHGATNQRFDELFVEQAGRNVAEPVLIAGAPDERAKLQCLLLIVYRLRNNLFHGNKEIHTFNDQKENLDHATAVLAKVMEWHGVS